jgi:hypothetical protein
MVHTMRHLGCVSLNWELSGIRARKLVRPAMRAAQGAMGLVRVFSPACMEGIGICCFRQRRSMS